MLSTKFIPYIPEVARESGTISAVCLGHVQAYYDSKDRLPLELAPAWAKKLAGAFVIPCGDVTGVERLSGIHAKRVLRWFKSFAAFQSAPDKFDSKPFVVIYSRTHKVHVCLRNEEWCNGVATSPLDG